MIHTLNFLDTAGTIADVEHLPGKAVPALLRRIRLFDAKELIPVHREESGRREGRLDVFGACMAVIHSELLDFGVDAATLRRLREFLDGKADLFLDGTQLAVAVDAVKAGKPVSLEVTLLQRAEPSKKWHGFRLIGHIEKDPKIANAAAAYEAAEGIVTRARLSLDLNLLLAAFIEAFESAADATQSKG